MELLNRRVKIACELPALKQKWPERETGYSSPSPNKYLLHGVQAQGQFYNFNNNNNNNNSINIYLRAILTAQRPVTKLA
jgi:hypothetical protein